MPYMPEHAESAVVIDFIIQFVVSSHEIHTGAELRLHHEFLRHARHYLIYI